MDPTPTQAERAITRTWIKFEPLHACRDDYPALFRFSDPRRQFQRFAADEDLRCGDDAAVATDWTSSIPARSGEW